MTTTPNTTTAHGPGRVPSLRPGRRVSVMIGATGADPTAALENTLPWITAFEAGCGARVDPTQTQLYALAFPEHLTRVTSTDPEHGPAVHIDAILANGQWTVRGEDPQAWQATYNAALNNAPEGTVFTVWDVHPLP